MNYSKYIRDDIDFKILSNVELSYADIEKDRGKFIKKLKNYDLGVWSKNIMLNEDENLQTRRDIDKIKFNEIEIYNSKGELIEWQDIVLNYMKSLNTFMREQIGICIEKQIPRIIDNELTYLIVQRKNYKDFNENFFIAMDYEVIFPMITKEYDFNLAVIKLAEWAKRANRELEKFDKIALLNEKEN
jgi:hypothetical protein